jgi:hypothetical protein
MALSLRAGCFSPITLTHDVICCGMPRPSSMGCVHIGLDNLGVDAFFPGMTKQRAKREIVSGTNRRRF